jgi:hypothetical protein
MTPRLEPLVCTISTETPFACGLQTLATELSYTEHNLDAPSCHSIKELNQRCTEDGQSKAIFNVVHHRERKSIRSWKLRRLVKLQYSNYC